MGVRCMVFDVAFGLERARVLVVFVLQGPAATHRSRFALGLTDPTFPPCTVNLHRIPWWRCRFVRLGPSIGRCTRSSSSGRRGRARRGPAAPSWVGGERKIARPPEGGRGSRVANGGSAPAHGDGASQKRAQEHGAR